MLRWFDPVLSNLFVLISGSFSASMCLYIELSGATCWELYVNI